MIRFSMWRLLAATGFSILGLTYACSAPGDGAASGDSAESSALEIHFPAMYSTFDSAHAAKIPAVVTGVKKVKWSLSDPSLADLEVQSDGSAMITTRAAGTVTVLAKAGSLVGQAELLITAAADGEWEAGNQRYNNGIVLKRGEHGADGGGGAMNDPTRKQASCTNCHGTGGSDSSHDVEHTPMQTGGYTDDELVTIFTKGQKPDGVPQRIMPFSRWNKIHQWSMDENAVKGIVVYLRTLEPKSQGAVDFGGHGPKGNQKPSSGVKDPASSGSAAQ